MNTCPKCDGLLLEDTDEENFSVIEEPISYYCPGCGWSSEDIDEESDEDEEFEDWDDYYLN